ncbi:MAG: ABC transporter permease, partial [Clostridia bacterium]|nr:ABC transporter permease [Clostridia bacterium]
EIDDEKNMIISPYLENISLSIPDGSFTNWYEYERNNERVMRVLFFGLYCIVALFLIICGSVINNALTARIREGKREIGTLRAVGADLKILSSSYIKQLLSVFGWGNGLGFGLYTVGYVLFAVMNKAMKWGKELFEFRILETILMCGVLFLICSLNLYIKIKQEMRHSIVENIREL